MVMILEISDALVAMIFFQKKKSDKIYSKKYKIVLMLLNFHLKTWYYDFYFKKTQDHHLMR